MQSFCFAQFIQQISSLSTEQWRIGVWRIDSADIWSIAPKHGEIRRESERSIISKVGTIRSGPISTDTANECSSNRETACICILKDLKKCRERSNFRKLVNLRDSWGESPKLFTMWMIASEVRPKPPERLHYLVIIQIPNLTHGSVDTPGSIQFFKSKSYVVSIITELRYEHRQHQETDQTSGLSYPEDHTATWRNRGMNQITLLKVEKLYVIQAMGDETR